MVVEAWVLEEVEECSGGAGFGVWGAVDEVGYSGVEDGSGAHGAGFECDGEGAAEEAPGSEFLRGEADGDDLGVCGGVFVAFAAVLAGGEEGVVGGEDDGADGNLAGCGGEGGLFEGEADEVLGGHGGEFNTEGTETRRAQRGGRGGTFSGLRRDTLYALYLCVFSSELGRGRIRGRG